MRLFIAIDFNELGEYFSYLQKQLPTNSKLNLTKSFHLTLKFLGEVQPDKAKMVVSSLKSIKFESFYVLLDSIGAFPSKGHIRVVWAGLQPEDKILKLQKEIDDSLKYLFRKEKDFNAHVTLARVKSVEDRKLFFDAMERIKIEKKKIMIKDFRLVKSVLTPNGSIYEDLVVFNP